MDISGTPIRKKKPLRFIHITKTAGSSIELIAKEHGRMWGKFDKEYGFWHAFFPNKPESLKSKNDWFMVVRNPYTRVVSEYFYLCKDLRVVDKIRTKEHMNTFIQTWLKNIQENKPNHPVYGRAGGDHFSPQYKYLDPGHVIHVLKFENLKEEFNALMMAYSLPMRLTRHDEAGVKKIYTDADLSSETIALINDIYKQDFEQFGYEMRSV